VATVAASATDAFPPAHAGIGFPRAVTVAADGRILIASSKPNAVFELAADGLRVLRIDPLRKEHPLAGGPELEFAGIAACGDGGVYLSAGREVLAYTAPDRWTSLRVALASPALTRPAGLACDPQHRLVIADAGAHRIWRFDPRRATLDSIAGGGLPGDSGDGGPAVDARLSSPQAVAVAADGTVFIADRGNRRIRWIKPDHQMGGTTGPPPLADPTGLAVISTTHLAVVDSGNHRVYRFAVQDGLLTLVAGNGEGFTGDGGPAVDAQLRRPSTVAATVDGVLVVADAGNRRLRQITRAGIISTAAGNGGFGWVGDGGPALAARVAPAGLALDGAGNVYVVEAAHHRVRRIARQTGLITTLAGTGLAGSGGDGGPGIAAELSSPSALAVAADGTVYVGDTGNRRIRRISVAGRIDTFTGGWNESCCETRSLAVTEGALLIAEPQRLYRVPLPAGERSLVWSRRPGDPPTTVKLDALERIDAMSLGAGGDVYVSYIHPGTVRRVDLATGGVQLVMKAPPEAPGTGPIPGPTTLALAARTSRLLFANLWSPCVFSMDIASLRVTTVADLSAAADASVPIRPGVTAVAASNDAIYFADRWRVFRMGPSSQPEVVAGGGNGY
jgi:sugar lactone lactonase YvrE